MTDEPVEVSIEHELIPAPSKTSNIAPFEQSLRRIPRKGWSFQGLSDYGFPLAFYGTSGVYENRG